MKKNKLTIQIDKPIHEVFSFTITPMNTRKWIDSIIVEKSNEWPIKIGSQYRNKSKDGDWDEYTVTNFEEDKIFELVSKDKNYHVRYTYKPRSGSTSELEYFEWVDKGGLDNPFTKTTLEKLKSVLET